MFPVLVIGLRIVFLADGLSANQGSEVIKCGTLTQLRVCMQISKITACFITMHLHYYGLTTNIVCVVCHFAWTRHCDVIERVDSVLVPGVPVV